MLEEWIEDVPGLKVDFQLIDIGCNICTADFSGQDGLGQGEESGGESVYAGLFKGATGHHSLPSTGDFDADAGPVETGLEMLEELDDSWFM